MADDIHKGTRQFDSVKASDAEVNSLTATGSLDVTPSLTHIATLSDTDLGRPHDIKVDNGIAVTAGKDGNICVVDLYPRENPAVTHVITGFTDSQSVGKTPARYPNFTWFVGENDRLLSTLADPRGLGDVARTAYTTGARANGFAWFNGQDTLSLYAAFKSGYVEAFDVSDFDNPTSINSYNTTAGSPHDIATYGPFTAIVNQTDGATPKIELINSSTGAGAEVASSWSTDATFSDSQLNGANRIETHRGGYAVVANNLANTLATVNLQDTANISLADVVSDGASDGPSGLMLLGDYAVAVSDDRVTIYDIADPTNMTEVDQYIFSSAISGHDPAVDGRYLYVTGQSTDTIEVFDLGYHHAILQQAVDVSSGAA